MSTRWMLLTLLVLMGGLVTLPVSAAETGVRFTVAVSSEASPDTVTVVTSILGDAIRTDSTSATGATTSITREGFTYLLDPKLKLAQATPVRPPAASDQSASAKYWALVDPLQVVPANLLPLFKTLGATAVGGPSSGEPAPEQWSLTIPADVQFPLNHFVLAVNAKTKLPERMDFQRGDAEQVHVVFKLIEMDAALNPKDFEVPTGYAVVEYDW